MNLSGLRNPKGKTAGQIVRRRYDTIHSTHIFKAVAWLDLAKREKDPDAIHHAAFQIRYGVEYLLFELLILSKGGLSEPEYLECVADRHRMEKLLKSQELSYEKLAEFTRIVAAMSPGMPKIKIHKLRELMRTWGDASRYLHFVGSHDKTYGSLPWIEKAIQELSEVVRPLWEASTMHVGFGLSKPDTMPPEVLKTWEDFRDGKIDDSGVRMRLEIARPILRRRAEQLKAATELWVPESYRSGK